MSVCSLTLCVIFQAISLDAFMFYIYEYSFVIPG